MNSRRFPADFLRTGVRLVVAVLLAAPAAAGCRRAEPDTPVVAAPSFSISRDRVAIGSPVELTYSFRVEPGAEFDGNYRVFVHVLDPDNERLWTDDHDPPTPTSQWKPGETVEYTRTVFVPNYPYIGEAVVRLGLYSPETGQRLRLAGNEASRREYVVGRFQLLPQSENIFLIDKAGWHPAEVAAHNPAIEWRWTERRAVLSFRNPRTDATFFIEYDARPDQFSPAQQVTIRAGEQEIGRFAAEARDPALQVFPVSAENFGDGDMAEISIEVDRTFVPGEGDTRELGIRIFHVFLQPR
jgi:hypothetical protein